MLPRALCTNGSSCSSLRAAAASRSRLRAALAAPVRRLLGLGSGSSTWQCGSERLGVAVAAQQRRPAASALEAVAEADGASEALRPPPIPRPQLRHPGSHLHLAAQPRPLAADHPHPGIEIFLGPMFAGKSTALLRRVAELEAKGFNVAVVKSSKDDRYCSSSVVTHNGLKRVRGGWDGGWQGQFGCGLLVARGMRSASQQCCVMCTVWHVRCLDTRHRPCLQARPASSTRYAARPAATAVLCGAHAACVPRGGRRRLCLLPSHRGG